LGPAAHEVFCHGMDKFDMLPFEEAKRATEDSMDHLFSYYYNVAPSICPRYLAGLRNAMTTWQMVIESWVCGMPLANSQQLLLASNSAY
jgi:hypothetical protein